MNEREDTPKREMKIFHEEVKSGYVSHWDLD